MKILLLKPDELVLKSKHTRKRFEKALYQNIRECLRNSKIEILELKQRQSRYVLKTDNDKKASKALKEVPGLSYISFAEEVPLEKIKETALKLSKLNSKKSFGVRAKSLNKNLSSKQLNIDVGKFIQEKTKASVDLTEPDVWVFIEVVGEQAYIYTEKIQARKGLPVGVSGKVIAVISGKDDLLAAKMIEARGAEIIEFKTKLPFKDALKKAEGLAEEYGAKAIVLGLKKLPEDIPKSRMLVFTPLVGL